MTKAFISKSGFSKIENFFSVEDLLKEVLPPVKFYHGSYWRITGLKHSGDDQKYTKVSKKDIRIEKDGMVYIGAKQFVYPTMDVAYNSKVGFKAPNIEEVCGV